MTKQQHAVSYYRSAFYCPHKRHLGSALTSGELTYNKIGKHKSIIFVSVALCPCCLPKVLT